MTINQALTLIDVANDDARFTHQSIELLYQFVELAIKKGVIFDSISCYDGDAIELTAIQQSGEKRQLIVDDIGNCLLVWYKKGDNVRGKEESFDFNETEFSRFITILI